MGEAQGNAHTPHSIRPQQIDLGRGYSSSSAHCWTRGLAWEDRVSDGTLSSERAAQGCGDGVGASC